MALIKCKECGHQISNKAKTCSNCGIPLPKKTSVLTWLVTILIGLGVFSAIMSPSKSPDQKIAEKQKIAENQVKEETIIEMITAAELASAYNDNTVAADQKFKGKKFKVSGVVDSINTDIFGNQYITLRGGVNQFMEPQFKFEKSATTQLSNLKKGTSVVLVCEGNGDIAKTPMSKSCSIF